jgi:hypothetical protein
MQLEAKISFEADELRSMAEHQAEAKYPAPDGMRWVAIAAYAYDSGRSRRARYGWRDRCGILIWTTIC